MRSRRALPRSNSKAPGRRARRPCRAQRRSPRPRLNLRRHQRLPRPSHLPRPSRLPRRNPIPRRYRPRRPAAEPERVVSFEEKFGTRWTVWIGGVALALGGIFLVKYSIEAGLIGPRLRLFFGALARGRACCWRRMGAPAKAARRLRRAARRRHPEHPDRRRHHRRLCHGLCGLRALRLPRSGLCLRAARRGGAGDARRGAAARSGARGARPCRRLRDAAARRLDRAELLGALHLSRGGDGGRIRARSHAAVAMAGADRRRLRFLLAAAGHPGQRRRGAGGASVPRRGGLCAVGRADRRRTVLWPVVRARKDRSALRRSRCRSMALARSSWCSRAGTTPRRSPSSPCSRSPPSPLPGAPTPRPAPCRLQRCLPAS